MAETNHTGNRTPLQSGVTANQFFATMAGLCILCVTGFVGVILSSNKEIAVMQTQIAEMQKRDEQIGAEQNTQNLAITDLGSRVTIIEVSREREAWGFTRDE